MFEISVKTGFSSAHFLKGYPGVCERLHGHNWEVEVALRGRRTDALGLLADFRQVKRVLKEVVDPLDHRELNSLPLFVRKNPSSENLARYLFQALARRLNSRRLKVQRVRVSEGTGTSASYWESA
ncbi:MAG: 6-carboxytetrahydropterin synthase QueD [Lentisphaerae bacterium]|nr:6-carboxytetrahydropterin synthase QueD [Lentisphaerota bacterium]